MSYVFLQILACLFLAGFLGVLLGWFLSKNSYEKRAKKLEDLWRLKFVDVKDEHYSEIKTLRETNQKELYEKSKEIEKLKQELSSQGSLDKDVSLLKAENQRLKDELNKAKESIQNTSKDWEAKLRNSMKDFEIRKIGLEKTISRLEGELKQKEFNTHENGTKVQALIDDKKALNAKIKGLESVINSKEQKEKEYQQKLDSLSKELKSLQEKIKEREQEVVKNSQINTKFENEVNNFKSKIALLESKYKVYEEQLAQKERELEQLKSKMQDSTNLQREIQTYKSTIESLRKQLNDKNNEKQAGIELSKKLNILQMQLEKQESISKKYEDEIKSYRKKVEELNRKIKESDEIWRERIENLLKGK